MIRAAAVGLAVVCATGAGAQSVSKQQISRAFGYTDTAQFKPAVVEIANNLGRYNCGGAMTPAACRSVDKHLRKIVPNSINLIRRDALNHIQAAYAGRGGLAGAMAEYNALPQDQKSKKLCTGNITLRCKLLFDSMFKSLIPLVNKARKRAAREVKPFYKDGRPFKG
jgi:hypothetical protein